MQETEGTWTGLKKTIVGTLATVVTAGGAWLGTTLFGGGSDNAAPAPAPAPVINITNSNQQAQQAAGGKTVIIKEKASSEKPAEKKEEKKKDEWVKEEPKW